MAQFFRVLGHMTGRAIRSHAFDRAITAAAGYVMSELRFADIKAKRTLLKRKHTNHLRLLGKTSYRLIQNDIDLTTSEHITRIVRVLDEIKAEIDEVERELASRQESMRKKSEHQENTRKEK